MELPCGHECVHQRDEAGVVGRLQQVHQFVDNKVFEALDWLLGQRADDLLVDLVADIARALEGEHVLEASAGRDGDRRVGLAGVFVADVLDEQQDQDVVLVLTGVHAAAQLIAAGPQGAIQFGFLQGHLYVSLDIQPK